MNKFILKYFFLIFYLCHLNAQNLNVRGEISNNAKSLKRVYTSDISGNLFININIWGASNNTGQLQVPEGIDMVDVLSLIGGPSNEDNYKKIKIIREYSDENINNIIFVDMSEFFKNGDKSYLPKILPNDTIIIKKKLGYLLVNRIGEISNTLTLLAIILNFLN